MQLSPVKAVLFDMDGTLVNSLPVLYGVYREFLADFGHEGSEAEFGELSGTTLSQVAAILKMRYSLEPDVQNLLNHYHNKVMTCYTTYALPTEGGPELLRFLSENNIRMALVTSAFKRLALDVLDRFGWHDYFELLVTADDVTRYKPHPEPYLRALNAMGLQPQEALAVEDSLDGLAAALTAEIPVIKVVNPTNAHQPLPADALCDLTRLDDMIPHLQSGMLPC